MNIRRETPADFAAVERLTLAAFGTFTYPDGSIEPTVNEHYLVHIMRSCAAFVPELAFVSVLDGEVIANIMYTRSKIIRPNSDEVETLTFGPVSVKPELHKRGLGAEIIRHSLDCARELGYGAVIILGHPQYYPRFGFVRAEEFNLAVISHDETVFDGAFMALELRDGYLGKDGGTWQEDKVFAVDQAAFAAWHKEF
jgi:predicted N-acetyltransferase YhbS